MNTYRNAHRIALAFLAACILTCATLTTDAAFGAQARPVTLAMANTPPTFLSNLGPGNYVDAGDPATGFACAQDEVLNGYFTDTSAYTWKGAALSGQRWNADRTVTYWRDRSGRSVTFDGVRFRNHTNHAVMVAGWCQ